MLIVGLDSSKKEPLYEQIYTCIKEEIRTGALPFGSKLPSARRMAKHLDVSRNTVDLAYGQLVAEGYIESKPKRGFYVCQVEELAALNIPIKKEEEETEVKEEIIPFDFSPNGVDMTQFPYHIWRKILKEIMIDDNSELFQKGNYQGDLELRRAIMYYLRQSRGVHVNTNQIVLGAGMENLLFDLRQMLGNHQIVGIENPVYPNAYAILNELGFGIQPVSMDEDGLSVSELEKTCANLAYVTPAHQYPTGVVMPVGRRSQLIHWAKEKEERYIIEDDYDSEFRYHGKPIPALQGLDQSDKVIYMGTFSKAIAPAIRISYMVLPQKLVPVYKEKCSAFSCSVSRIDQRILTLFLSEGHFEKHLNRMRNIYKEKHDCLLKCMKEMPVDTKISGQGSGLHVIADFNISNDASFQQKLEAEGVKIYPLSKYYIQGKPEKEQYILGFTRMEKKDIIEGTRKMKEVLFQLN